ncbi:MAG: cation diffusion facilitator family transporter [Methylophilaceae bacterium]|jgi:cobalt-zinc-cadmium efflux system protein|nr:cation diffusion facilitator family transporter [Methylophilaceae bacterium]
MTHHHDHSHVSGHHGRDVLLLPLLLTAGFAVVEALGGWLTGSLALLGDAGHMASDAAALALAWLGAWLSRKPANARHTYGFLRAEVLVALLNTLIMLGVVVAIVLEAIERMQSPQPVAASGVMLIAFVGLLINLFVARHLHRGQSTINHRAALLHVMGDLLGSVAALTAGAVIYFTGWTMIDPLLSLFIALLILVSTLRLLREVVHMLMEGVPAHLDLDTIRQRLMANAGVEDVHHLRVWSLSSQVTALSAHVVVGQESAWPHILQAMRRVLSDEFHIQHVILQPEFNHAGRQDADGCWLTEKPDGQE